MNQPTNARLASNAANALRNSQRAIEALLDATPKVDHFTLGALGPILADLRSAQASIEQLTQSPNHAQ